MLTLAELDALSKDIDALRSLLYELIQKKGLDLQDPEIIAASEVLNAAIVRYTEMLHKKL